MIIRPTTSADAPDMAALLNDIVAIGESTAQEGKVISFQSLVWASDTDDPMPDGWAVIASFVALDVARKGVGGHLFRATRVVAKAAGVITIDAIIRADNVAGLRLYNRLLFVDYDQRTGVPPHDETPVDRLRKRYYLVEAKVAE